ncbi:MAG TPA: carboxypeptidase regulatory-like domain-containing protein, partial [Gemmatimonadaceae bacterium]
MKASLVRNARTIMWSVFLMILPGLAAAQADTGLTSPAERPARILGRIVDAKTGAGLSDVVVIVEGTDLSARSVIDGRFSISSVPVGRVTLLAKRLGYSAKR